MAKETGGPRKRKSKAFDRKLGSGFLKSIPLAPGVYRVFDVQGALVYVGKAKLLRRRLSQYRNAKRIKAHAKMRLILESAARIEWEVCTSEQAALERELELIQKHRPRLNLSGAFNFLYPLVGVWADKGFTTLVCTSSPDAFPEFRLHGAFRSRGFVRESFEALVRLLRFVAPPAPRRLLFAPGAPGKRDRFALVTQLRALDPAWVGRLEAFLEGRSREALEELVMALVDNPRARQKSGQVQRDLNLLKAFWRHEARPLFEMRKGEPSWPYPVPQAQRDLLRIRHSFRDRG